jgi:single-strand DNA-binding protein
VGRLKQSRWVDPDGKPQARVSIVAEHIEFRPEFNKAVKEKDNDDTAQYEAEAEMERELEEAYERAGLEEVAA